MNDIINNNKLNQIKYKDLPPPQLHPNLSIFPTQIQRMHPPQ